MKFKSVITALFLSLFLVGSAYAMPWSWDLSGLSTGGIEAKVSGISGWSTTINFAEKIGVENGGTYDYTRIVQNLGSDNVLNNGDTFSELGFLGQVSIDGNAILFRDVDDNDKEYYSYYKFSGLTGSINNYSDGGDGLTTISSAGSIANDTFNLTFDPNVGTIEFWIDDDQNTTNGGFAKLADFTLLQGEGTAPEFVIFEAEAEGQFGMKIGFTDVLDGVWSFAGGTFEDWLALYGPSSIMMNSLNLGATLKAIDTADGGDGNHSFLLDVENIGAFGASAVPEPATMVLFGIGLLGLAGVTRKKLS
jgi:hypothetical protein